MMAKSNFMKKKISTFSNNIKDNKKDKIEEVDNFKGIKSVTVNLTEGDIPDSKAYFICGIKNKSEIFIYGGCDINKQNISHEVYFYDRKNRYWECLSNISRIKHFLGLSSDLSGHSFEKLNINGEIKLFVFGGFNGNEYSNKSFLVDCESFECFEPIDYLKGNTPDGRCYHTSNYYEKLQSIYIFGGWGGNPFILGNDNFSTLWKLQNSNGGFSWEKIKLYANDIKNIQLNNKRGHTSNLIQNCLYIFGGIEGFTRYTNNLLVINLETNFYSFEEMKGQEPEPRAFHSSIDINDYNIIITGGISYFNKVLSDIFIINILNKEYIRYESDHKELERFGHKILKFKDEILIFGGFRSIDDLLLKEDNLIESTNKNTFNTIVTITVNIDSSC